MNNVEDYGVYHYLVIRSLCAVLNVFSPATARFVRENGIRALVWMPDSSENNEGVNK